MSSSCVMVDDQNSLHCQDCATKRRARSRAPYMPCGYLRNSLVLNKFHEHIHADFAPSSQVVHIPSPQLLPCAATSMCIQKLPECSTFPGSSTCVKSATASRLKFTTF